MEQVPKELRELASTVEDCATEAAQKQAVTRFLAKHGYTKAPERIAGKTPDGLTARNYVWSGTPWGNVILATGPSCKPELHLVAGPPAKGTAPSGRNPSAIDKARGGADQFFSSPVYDKPQYATASGVPLPGGPPRTNPYLSDIEGTQVNAAPKVGDLILAPWDKNNAIVRVVMAVDPLKVMNLAWSTKGYGGRIFRRAVDYDLESAVNANAVSQIDLAMPKHIAATDFTPAKLFGGKKVYPMGYPLVLKHLAEVGIWPKPDAALYDSTSMTTAFPGSPLPGVPGASPELIKGALKGAAAAAAEAGGDLGPHLSAATIEGLKKLGQEKYGPADDAWYADLLNELVMPGKDKWTSPIPNNVSAKVYRATLAAWGFGKDVKVTKGKTYLANHHIDFVEGLSDTERANIEAYMGVVEDVQWNRAAGVQIDQDPGADYPYQGAGGWLVPGVSVPLVKALIVSAALRNELTLTPAAGQLSTPAYAAPATVTEAPKAASQGWTTGAVRVHDAAAQKLGWKWMALAVSPTAWESRAKSAPAWAPATHFSESTVIAYEGDEEAMGGGGIYATAWKETIDDLWFKQTLTTISADYHPWLRALLLAVAPIGSIVQGVGVQWTRVDPILWDNGYNVQRTSKELVEVSPDVTFTVTKVGDGTLDAPVGGNAPVIATPAEAPLGGLPPAPADFKPVEPPWKVKAAQAKFALSVAGDQIGVFGDTFAVKNGLKSIGAVYAGDYGKTIGGVAWPAKTWVVTVPLPTLIAHLKSLGVQEANLFGAPSGAVAGAALAAPLSFETKPEEGFDDPHDVGGEAPPAKAPWPLGSIAVDADSTQAVDPYWFAVYGHTGWHAWTSDKEYLPTDEAVKASIAKGFVVVLPPPPGLVSPDWLYDRIRDVWGKQKIAKLDNADDWKTLPAAPIGTVVRTKSGGLYRRDSTMSWSYLGAGGPGAPLGGPAKGTVTEMALAMELGVPYAIIKVGTGKVTAPAAPAKGVAAKSAPGDIVKQAQIALLPIGSVVTQSPAPAHAYAKTAADVWRTVGSGGSWGTSFDVAGFGSGDFLVLYVGDGHVYSNIAYFEAWAAFKSANANNVDDFLEKMPGAPPVLEVAPGTVVVANIEEQEAPEKMASFASAVAAATTPAWAASWPHSLPVDETWTKMTPEEVCKGIHVDWSQQLGSNPGGVGTYKGQKFYVKKMDKMHAWNEVSAAWLYRVLGVGAPDLRACPIKGSDEVWIMAPWVGLKLFLPNTTSGPVTPFALAYTFAADVWLADWDVVGANYENLQINTTIDALWRVDAGGSMWYRAQGKMKNSSEWSHGSFTKTLDAMTAGGGTTSTNTTASVFGPLLATDEGRKAFALFIQERIGPIAMTKAITAVLDAAKAATGVDIQTAATADILFTRAVGAAQYAHTVTGTIKITPPKAPAPVAWSGAYLNGASIQGGSHDLLPVGSIIVKAQPNVKPLVKEADGWYVAVSHDGPIASIASAMDPFTLLWYGNGQNLGADLSKKATEAWLASGNSAADFLAAFQPVFENASMAPAPAALPAPPATYDPGHFNGTILTGTQNALPVGSVIVLAYPSAVPLVKRPDGWYSSAPLGGIALSVATSPSSFLVLWYGDGAGLHPSEHAAVLPTWEAAKKTTSEAETAAETAAVFLAEFKKVVKGPATVPATGADWWKAATPPERWWYTKGNAVFSVQRAAVAPSITSVPIGVAGGSVATAPLSKVNFASWKTGDEVHQIEFARWWILRKTANVAAISVVSLGSLDIKQGHPAWIPAAPWAVQAMGRPGAMVMNTKGNSWYFDDGIMPPTGGLQGAWRQGFGGPANDIEMILAKSQDGLMLVRQGGGKQFATQQGYNKWRNAAATAAMYANPWVPLVPALASGVVLLGTAALGATAAASMPAAPAQAMPYELKGSFTEKATLLEALPIGSAVFLSGDGIHTAGGIPILKASNGKWGNSGGAPSNFTSQDIATVSTHLTVLWKGTGWEITPEQSSVIAGYNKTAKTVANYAGFIEGTLKGAHPAPAPAPAAATPPTPPTPPTAAYVPPTPTHKAVSAPKMPPPAAGADPMALPQGSVVTDKDGDEWTVAKGYLLGQTPDVEGIHLPMNAPTLAPYGPWKAKSIATGEVKEVAPEVLTADKVLPTLPVATPILITPKGKLWVRGPSGWNYTDQGGGFSASSEYLNWSDAKMLAEIKSREGGGNKSWYGSANTLLLEATDEANVQRVSLRKLAGQGDPPSGDWTRLIVLDAKAAAAAPIQLPPTGIKGKRAAAGALIVAGDYVLLAKRAAWLAHGDEWAIPAGSLDPGEKPMQAALREATEELGSVPPGLLDTGMRLVADLPGVFFTTVIFRASTDSMKAWRPDLAKATHGEETTGWAWVHRDELELDEGGGVTWTPKLMGGVASPFKEDGQSQATMSMLGLWKTEGKEWMKAAEKMIAAKQGVSDPSAIKGFFDAKGGLKEGMFDKLLSALPNPRRTNPEGYTFSGVMTAADGSKYVEYRPRLLDGTRPRIKLSLETIAVAVEQVAQEMQEAVRASYMGTEYSHKQHLAPAKSLVGTGLTHKKGTPIWTPGSLPYFEEVMRRVLGVAKPTRGDVAKAALFDLIGLPLTRATERIRQAHEEPAVPGIPGGGADEPPKEPPSGGGPGGGGEEPPPKGAPPSPPLKPVVPAMTGTAKLTSKQIQVVDTLYAQMLGLLGTSPHPDYGQGAADPAWAKQVKAKLRSVVKGMESSGSEAADKGVISFFATLAAARAVGLWPTVLDPGNRVAFHGTNQGPARSKRIQWTDESLAAAKLAYDGGYYTGPFPPVKYTDWLKAAWSFVKMQAAQGAAPPGWVPDGLKHHAFSNWSLAGPETTAVTIEGKSYSLFQTPAWATDPWANVPGFPAKLVSFSEADGTGHGKPMVLQWSAGSRFSESSYGQQRFLFRADTSYPGFVNVPERMLDFQKGEINEFELHLVPLRPDGEENLRVEIVFTRPEGSHENDGGTLVHLTARQMGAYTLSRPPYAPERWKNYALWETLPERFKKFPPAHNPRPPAHNPRRAPPGMKIQSLVFARTKFTPTTARAWAQGHEFEWANDRFDITKNMIRIRQQDPDEFDDESFRTISLADGIKAIVARPLGGSR